MKYSFEELESPFLNAEIAFVGGRSGAETPAPLRLTAPETLAPAQYAESPAQYAESPAQYAESPAQYEAPEVQVRPVPKRSALRMPEAAEPFETLQEWEQFEEQLEGQLEEQFEDDQFEVDFERDVPRIELQVSSPEIDAALAKKDWSAALALAIAAGERDESKLTNLLFFALHPDLDRTRKLDPKNNKDDAKLAQEWTKLRDREVWAAIEKSAQNSVLAVKGKEVASEHRVFWTARGKSFKALVQWAAKEVELDPGLLATALLAETGAISSYLAKHKISSYHVGVDDFYALRTILSQNVPAYAKIGWDKKQKPVEHLNDAKKPRMVKTIYFDSGRDALLATSVYLKYAEVRQRQDAKSAGGDFDALPLETRLALIRMSMAAGRAGADVFVQRALKGQDVLIRNWKPAKIYQTQRNATIRAAQALHISDWIFGNKPPALTQPELEHESDLGHEHEQTAFEHEHEHEHQELEHQELEHQEFEREDDQQELESDSELEFEAQSELGSDSELELDAELELQEALDEHLGLFDLQVPAGTSSPTLGFEFDLNFGFERKLVNAKGLTPPAGFRWPSEGLKVTDHESKDGKGGLADGFVVTMDAVRMEIGTAPFHIDDDTEFKTVVDGVVKFGKELVAAKKKRESSVNVPGVGGNPTTFEHPRTVVNKPDVDAHGNIEFPGDRDHAAYQLERFPLVVHRMYGKYPTKTGLWASPQATITLPLAEFGKLVWEIHETRNGVPGEAFTGRKKDRLGLRDDLAWYALTRAVADRKRKLGTTLSDGSSVSEADFSRSLTSIVTILLMYCLTSIEKDAEDERKEQFAKGSLPLNVKTPLWQIHKFALTDREKLVLHELYTDASKREQLYALASGSDSGNGTRKLFPTYTHADAKRFLGTEPTWDTLVDALVKEKPVIVTQETGLPKKGHKKGDEILIAPLSSKIVWDKTKPRIAVEMRRLGFDAVGFAKWPGLMKRLRALAVKVNP